ncbi:MAG: StbB family protein [Fimbriimonadaceae bacterium]
MNELKIAVLNFSGNVGKSTIARHLLSPYMPESALVAVETINAEAASEIKIKGSAFGQLQEDMMLVDRVIVDVGSSNVEQFLALMKQYRGSHEDFDLYLVPTVPASKQQKDTIECVRELARIGIPAEKIRIVFNLVAPGEDVAEVFAPLLSFVEKEGLAQASVRWTIWESELFVKIKGTTDTVAQIADDATDYKAAIRTATSDDEKLEYAARLTTKRLAQGVRENLSEVFQLVTA